MGNVVVSEALRNAGGQQIVENYIASQAAETASAYNTFSPWMQIGVVPRDPIFLVTAWRAANFDSLPDSEYDMAPNYYTYDVPAIHGATIPLYERAVATAEGWGPNYYHTIDQAAGRIINFHNIDDAALDGWELNQLTKPDFTDGPTWEYDWTAYCGPDELICDPFPDHEDGEQVTDTYTEDGDQLTWNLSTPINLDAAKIIGHIVTARTGPLGQAGETGQASVITAERGFSFGDSNQGHSAQYYSSFLERKAYWDTLLIEFRLKNVE